VAVSYTKIGNCFTTSFVGGVTIQETSWQTFKIILFLVCFFQSFLVHATDANHELKNQWTTKTESIYESAEKKNLRGGIWAIKTEKKEMLFAFFIAIAKGSQSGEWRGDIRTWKEIGIYGIYYFDNKDKSHRLKIEQLRRLDSVPFNKNEKLHRLSYLVKWDEILKLKNVKFLRIDYETRVKPKKSHSIKISLTGFETKLNELASAIKKETGSEYYLFSQERIHNTPIGQLPNFFKRDLAEKIKSLLDTKRGQLPKVSITISGEEALKNSFNQVKALIENRFDRLYKEKQKAHRLIYDQEPNWMDMNVCPNSDIRYCRNVGKYGYENERVFQSSEPYSFGKIQGVVWRPKNSIIKIYGGHIKYGIEPKISRTSVAGYRYLFFNKRGRVENVVPVDSIHIKKHQ